MPTGHSQSKQVQNSYREMKKALIDRYHMVMKDTDMHRKFMNLCQGETELISDFMSRWTKEKMRWLDTC